MKKQIRNIILSLTMLLAISHYGTAQTGATCNTANPIGAIPFNGDFTTCGAGNDFTSTPCGNNGHIEGQDYVFTYTPATDEALRINLTKTHADEIGLYVFDGCPDAGGINCTGSSVESPFDGFSPLSVGLTAGQTYYIVVSSQDFRDDCMAFTIDITPPPPGSVCETAKEIDKVPYSDNSSTTCNAGNDYATAPCGDESFLGGEEFVYKWTATMSGPISADLFNKGSNGELALWILDGCIDDPATTCIAYQEESVFDGFEAVDFNVVQGQTYYFLVSSEEWGSYPCIPFDFQLEVPTSCAMPKVIDNIPFSAKEMSTCSQVNSYGNGTACLDDPNYGGKDYLFQYTAPTDQCVQFKMSYYPDRHRYYRAGIALFEDCPENSTTCKEYRYNVQDRGAPGDSFHVSVNHQELKAGQTYYILVASGTPPGSGDADCFPFDLVIRPTSCFIPLPEENPNAIDCGNNVGFEDGNMNGWEAKWFDAPQNNYSTGGGCCADRNRDNPGYQNGDFLSNRQGFSHGSNSVNGPLGECRANSNVGGNGIDPPELGPRFTVTTGTGTDPNTDGIVPVVAPNGGTNSVRIGNHEPGWGAECMWTTFTVTPDNALLTYMYAVVLQDPPGHIHANKPRFEVKILDAQSNEIIDCGGKFEVVSVNAVDSFDLARNGCGSSVWFQNWKEHQTNLTNYLNQDVTIRFCTADCGMGGHFGYAYVDTYCKKVEPSGQEVCVIEGEAITLSAPSGGVNYEWRQGDKNGPVVGNEQTYTVTNAANGDHYTVTYSTPDGCATITRTDTLRTTKFPEFTLIDSVVCIDIPGNLQYTVSGSAPNGASISWTSTSGFSSNELEPVIPRPTVNTTYTVEIIQEDPPCTFTKSFEVSVIPCGLGVTLNCDEYCDSGCTIVKASVFNGDPPFTYYWSGDIPDPGNVDSFLICPTGTITYSVTVVDVDNDSASAVCSISVWKSPEIIAAKTDATCGACDGTAQVSITSGGTAPYDYLWSNGDSATQLSGLCPGNYCVTVTDANGCLDTACVIITNLGTHSITTTIDSVPCPGDTTGVVAAIITDDQNGPYTYQWDDAARNQTDSVAISLGAGAYVVTVTNAIGCVKIDTAYVYEPPPVVLSTIPTHIPCYGDSSGAIDLNASGGTPPLSYEWSTESGYIPPGTETTDDLAGLTPGIYSVIVTDANGCPYYIRDTITQPPRLTLTVDSGITCEGFCKGKAEAFPTGGTPPYQYAWNDPAGQTTKTADGLCAGPYLVTVTDNNGCIAIDTPFVEEVPAPPDSSWKFTDCPGAALKLPSSEGGISYKWSPVIRLSSANVPHPITRIQDPVTYTVTITHPTGCTSVDTVRINIKYDPSFTLHIPNSFTPNGDGENDYFSYVGDFTGLIEFECQIWNRWGEKIFQTYELTDYWNGRYNNKGDYIKDGAYVYIIKAKDDCALISNRPYTKIGWVIVLKGDS